MRILHLISSANPAGGGPIEGVTQLRAAVTDLGHQVTIATLDDPHAPWVKDHPAGIVALGPGRGKYGYSQRVRPWLKAHSDSYDAVITSGLWQYHSLAVWSVFRRSRVPYFVIPHGMLDPWFRQAYLLKHLKKSLYWYMAERLVLRDATGVLFTCQEERRLASQSFGFYRCTGITIKYGTSMPQGNPAEHAERFFAAFPGLRGARLILFLGRLHEKKGCDLLISAFAQLCHRDPRLHLVLAGPDETGWKKDLQKLAARHGVSQRISWTGMLRGELKLGALAAAEVFSLPSHQENFGIAVAEALAMGTPVLISEKVNIWREIEADRAGIVDADDEAGTKRCLEQWLNLDEKEQVAMGQRAKLCFSNRFEIGRAGERLIEVIQSASLRTQM